MKHLIDPYLQREKEKYGSPIASREFILEYLKKQAQPINLIDLAQGLGLLEESERDILHRRLRAMERDGQLIFTRRKCYALPEKLDLIKGKVIGHRDGYGFLDVEGQKEDIFLPYAEMLKVISGDIVLVQPLTSNSKGKREARIVRVLEPWNGLIVGRYFLEAGTGFVVPDDSRLNFDLLIPAENNIGARMGSVVVVELLRRPAPKLKALGRITEILGDNMGPEVAVEVALRSHDIPHEWPQALQDELSNVQEQVQEQDKRDRVDLRHLPLITIDGESARDFDDAVYCEARARGGWRLWVAIADVSYYVRPTTALDKEALQRGNSVYFPSRVVPMLPEVLSNGLCSLNPNVDRLVLVCEMTLSANGRLSNYQFYDAVMNSHARMTYTKVHRILEGDSELRERYHDLLTPITALHNLYKALDKARELRGGIDFESQEPIFIFNAQRRIERIETVKRNDAHKMIEESMIIANVAAAKYIEKYKQQAPFRVHDSPKGESFSALRQKLAELGLTLSGGDKPTPLDYSTLLRSIADRPDRDMLQTMVLRSLKQAIYDIENRGHFGLALSAYAHFTSPIRRYPDLLVHRTIKWINHQLNSSEQSIVNGNTATTCLNNGGYHYNKEEMAYFAMHCSMSERRADEAVRDVVDWLKCDFMRDQVGKIFSGMIVNVVGFGFFVRLDELFIDGLVHVTSLQNDYYHFDLARQQLKGESYGKTYRLGQKIQVRVEAVHMDERKIDFTLLAQENDTVKSKKPRRSSGNGKGQAKTASLVKPKLAKSAQAPKAKKTAAKSTKKAAVKVASKPKKRATRSAAPKRKATD